MNRPLVYVIAGYIIGILIGYYLNLNPGFLLLSAAAIFCLAAIFCFKAWQGNHQVLILLFIVLGCTAVSIQSIMPSNGLRGFAGRFVVLEGMVDRDPQIEQDSARYAIKVDTVKQGGSTSAVTGTVLAIVPGSKEIYHYGDRLQVSGIIYVPRDPGNFDTFNYREYLERRGIQCLIYLNGKQNVKLTGTGGGNKIVLVASKIKGSLMDIAGKTLDQKQAAVIGGLLFGDRSGIDDQTMDAFANTGVAHVLSVSGLHVGYVLALVLWLSGVLQLSRRMVLILVPAVLLLYALMTGMGPAVIRAAIMAAVVLCAAYWGREKDWLSGLALASLLILMFKPLLLFEIGFQLSFAATWGILYLGPALGGFFSQRLKLPGWLAMPLQVTVAAQLATLPIMLYYFNLLPFIAPLANLLLVPLVGVIMLSGFIGSSLGLILLPLGGLLNFVTGVLIDLFLDLAAFMAALPGGKLYLSAPPWYIYPFWYCCLILAVESATGSLVVLGRQELKKYIPAFVSICLIIAIFWPWSTTGGRMEVHFIDVGQGDSILVRFPGGHTMLVDAGGNWGDQEKSRAVGDNVVVPYLRRLGINHLDVLAVTHPHGDHAGGIPSVLENFGVGALVLTQAPGYEEFISDVPMGTNIYRVGSGQVLNLEAEAEALVLAPSLKAQLVNEDDLNNSSMVLKVRYGDVSFLLPGDIEEEAQRRLIADGFNIKADVLKVPHHGSGYFEPEFFKAAAAEYAVIEVGEKNRFGHPAAKTLQALSESGIKVLRTDKDGAVVISTNGKNINVKTARQ